MSSPHEFTPPQIADTEYSTQRYGTMYEASLNSVPGAVFSQGYQDIIPTPSRNALVCTVKKDMVDIYDPSEIINPDHPPDVADDPTYRFSAAIGKRDTYRIVSFYIRNRNPLSSTPNRRHPDIHPTALAARTLDYFQSVGLPVGAMQSYWRYEQGDLPVAIDNLREYRQNIAALDIQGRGPTHQERQRAAMSTMAGRLATRLGFSEAKYVQVSNREQSVWCLFVPPESSTS